MLNGILHLALAAQAGSIDERKYAVLVFDGGIHRVARRTRNIGNDAAVFAGNAVHKGRFADVRLTDDGDLDDLALVLLFLFLRQMLEDGIQQVARAVSVHGRHLNGVAEAEVIKLIKIRRRVAQRIHSHSPKMRSRVTPGVSSTMERRCPISLLNSVDLPTFGRPTMATIGLDIRFSSFFFPYSAVPKMSLSSPAASLCIL